MCLAVVAIEAHPRFPLVVAANRDEFHARPAAALDWWDADGESVLAGRDLQAGGTWFGVTRSGRWALVTNVREPSRHDPTAPSRGQLVLQLLRDRREPLDALATIVSGSARHNGYNALAGRGAMAAWASNRSGEPRALGTGVHGVSNALLDTPWPKVERARGALAAWIRTGGDDPTQLFDALADRTLARDAQLPSTGVSLEWERLLSAPFIVSAPYGTRCSTVLLLGRDGVAHMTERRFDAAGNATGETAQQFTLADAGAAIDILPDDRQAEA